MSRIRRRRTTPSVSSLALLGVAVATLAPLTEVESLERAAIPGGGPSSARRCTCHPCDCSSDATDTARPRGSRSHRSSSSNSSNRMFQLTLADQYERIISRSCPPRDCNKAIRTNYNYWRQQDLLEKRLLGIAEDERHGNDDGDDDDEEEEELVSNSSDAKIQVEVSAVYAGNGAKGPAASTQMKKSQHKSQHVTSYNPLRRLASLPNMEDKGQLPLIATGTVLAVSAIAVSIYLSGGLATSTTAAAVLSSCTPATTAMDKFHWFIRGGAANYASSRLSIGIGSIQRELSLPTVTTYVTKRAIPSALRILKKIAIMEVWRRVWILTFHQMGKLARKASRGTVHIYHRYTPLFIQRGLQSMFKSTVQKAVHGSVASWVGMAASGASDFVAGMLSTQMESIVQEVAEEAASAAVQDVVEEAVEQACSGVVEAAIDAVGGSD